MRTSDLGWLIVLAVGVGVGGGCEPRSPAPDQGDDDDDHEKPGFQFAIDRTDIALQSGCLAQEIEYGWDESDDGALLVIVSSLDDYRGAMLSFGESATDGPEDLAQAWRELFPRDFWVVQLLLRVDDPHESVDGASFDLPFEGVARRGDAEVSIVHYVDWLDEAYWGFEEGIELEDYLHVSAAETGSLEITAHTIDEALAGTLESTAEPNVGDIDGEVQLEFAVDRCVDLEDQLFD
jgi:hypothetical protein